MFWTEKLRLLLSSSRDRLMFDGCCSKLAVDCFDSLYFVSFTPSGELFDLSRVLIRSVCSSRPKAAAVSRSWLFMWLAMYGIVLNSTLLSLMYFCILMVSKILARPWSVDPIRN